MRRREETTSVAYLLGELDLEETAAFERAMAADPELRERVERLRPVVGRLERLPAEAWEPPAPPPLEVPASARAGGPRRLSLRPVTAMACAVALLAVGGAAGALIAREPDGSDRAAPPEARVALDPVPGAGDAHGSAAVAGNRTKQVTLTVSGLEPLAGNRFYELWLLGDDGELVSLGSFPVDRTGAATITVPLPVDLSRFQFLDVSREPADGDPGHSGTSVLRGRTTGA